MQHLYYRLERRPELRRADYIVSPNLGRTIAVCRQAVLDARRAIAWLQQQGRTEYAYATDQDALDAFGRLARLEGILPALESAHAIAQAAMLARDLGADAVILVYLSGRGDKDLATVQKSLA